MTKKLLYFFNKNQKKTLLMLFSFNVATNEADHSDSNTNNNLKVENLFACLVPELTPIGKLAFNISNGNIIIILLANMYFAVS